MFKFKNISFYIVFCFVILCSGSKLYSNLLKWGLKNGMWISDKINIHFNNVNDKYYVSNSLPTAGYPKLYQPNESSDYIDVSALSISYPNNSILMNDIFTGSDNILILYNILYKHKVCACCPDGEIGRRTRLRI